MSIEYAILGLLSWQPLSGYDLKKIISESELFYWSGNNNQIYNSLVRLHGDGLVTREVQPQENLPARKVYSITEAGRAALRQWVLGNPELPELRNAFLIQLAWAEALSSEELDGLLERYEAELAVKVRMQAEQTQRVQFNPGRTQREAYLWEQISANLGAVYQNELDWVRQLRAGLEEYL